MKYPAYVVKIFLLLCSPMYWLSARTIGSDEHVTLFTSAQYVGNKDRIATFAALNAGFFLGGLRGTSTFGALFPVTGHVGLRGGTLVLESDLVMQGRATIDSWGSIQAQGYSVVLAPGISAIPTNELCADLVCQTSDKSVVSSGGWSFDDMFFAAALQDKTVSKLGLYTFDGAQLKKIDEEPCDNLVNVISWHPTSYLLAVGKNVSTAKNALEIYAVNAVKQELNIVSSVPYATIGDIAAISWHPSGNFLAVVHGRGARDLSIYAVNEHGILSSEPCIHVPLAGSVQKGALDWDATGSFLALGVCNAKHDSGVYVYVFDKQHYQIRSRSFLHTDDIINVVQWNPSFVDVLAVAVDDASDQPLRIYKHDHDELTLAAVPAIDNGSVTMFSWSQNGAACVAKTIDKNDSRVQMYAFDRATCVLCKKECCIEKNDATVVCFDHKSQCLACCTTTKKKQASTSDISVFMTDVYLQNPDLSYVFSDGTLVLNSDVVIDNATIKFVGACAINGNGYALTLGSRCRCIVDSNSSLHFNDVMLKNVCDRNIQNADATGTIIFDDCSLLIRDTYYFSAGTFVLHNVVNILGEGSVFVYESEQKSSIPAYTKLILEKGVVFKYAPCVNNAELLSFADNTASLILNGAHVHVSAVGLNLLHGSMLITSDSVFSSDREVSITGAPVNGGISVGNGHAESDFTCSLLQASSLTISKNSSLHYKNVHAESWNMPHATSQLVLLSNATLYLHQSLNLDNGLLTNSGIATVAKEPSRQLIGKVINNMGQLVFSTIAE